MFGMLDYRAHKLYLILFGIPIFILLLISIFGLPLINYLFGIYFADKRVWQIIISIICIIPSEIVWNIFILNFANKIFNFIFGLFVDVIPSDGRTKDEAMTVVHNGEKGIVAIKILKNPKEWTDEIINDVAKIDWITYLFFKDVVINRLTMVREYFIKNPELEHSTLTTKQFLDANNLNIRWSEILLTNHYFRRGIVTYSFFVFLIIINPFAN